MKKTTLLLMSLVMTMCGYAQDNPVELPATAVAETWYASGALYQYGSSGWNQFDLEQQDLEYQVAIDGNDFYISGLDFWEPDTWVKGTRQGNTVTFTSGQFMAEVVEEGVTYKDYIVSLSMQTYDVANVFTMTYDEANQTLTLSDDYAIGLSDEANSNQIYFYYTPFALSKEKPAEEDPIALPAGVEAEEYIYEGNVVAVTSSYEIEETPFTTTANVAFDGNDVYVQGIFKDEMPYAWIKGSRNGDVYTFENGQFIGLYTYGTAEYKMYLLGFNEEEGVSTFTMTYNEEDNELVGNSWAISSISKTSVSRLEIFSGIVLYKEADAINEVSANDSEAIYFDTMGRRVSANAKGLLIKQVRNGKGEVRNVKVVR